MNSIIVHNGDNLLSPSSLKRMLMSRRRSCRIVEDCSFDILCPRRVQLQSRLFNTHSNYSARLAAAAAAAGSELLTVRGEQTERHHRI